ncbi:ELMO domain-containing protein 2 [Cichlidogyrus casuarinus]|uniref:ELMO domain-containing protein 2 n=1 Tax=Cichlidogyrus casuarinus TaxID=1844966 RepID=A0ABD2Q4J0_9PLAT
MFGLVQAALAFASRCFFLFLGFFYGFYKYAQHWVTGQCEIARICLNSSKNANYVLHLESSFNQSKSAKLRQVATCASEESVEAFVKYVIQFKAIRPADASKIQPPLTMAVSMLSSYSSLIAQMDVLIWSNVMPEENLAGRFTKQWEIIGFQGKDPATDFRGMGLFGFRNILYFTRNYRELAQRQVLASRHPTKGYFWAITAINLSELLYRQVQQQLWKPLFCTPAHRDVLTPAASGMDNLHEIFARIMHEFHDFWMLKQRDIMQFGRYRDQFKEMLELKYRRDPFSLLRPHTAN